jgi:hypothetical protein
MSWSPGLVTGAVIAYARSFADLGSGQPATISAPKSIANDEPTHRSARSISIAAPMPVPASDN